MGRDANRSYGMHGKKMPNVSNDDWQCFFFGIHFFGRIRSCLHVRKEGLVLQLVSTQVIGW